MVATAPLAGERGRAAAAEQLRSAIVRGDLLPAQRLVEQDLADLYGVTRSAVRAALLELTTEGLVERIPNKGSRVRLVTLEEAIAITEVRRELEGLCAAKAAELSTPDDHRVLRDIGDRMVAAVEASDGAGYSRLNKELHETLRKLSRQPVAQDVLSRLNAQLVRHRFQLAMRPERPGTSVTEHLAIIDAVCARDPDAARAAVHAHLASVIAAMSANPGPAGPA